MPLNQRTTQAGRLLLDAICDQDGIARELRLINQIGKSDARTPSLGLT